MSVWSYNCSAHTPCRTRNCYFCCQAEKILMLLACVSNISSAVPLPVWTVPGIRWMGASRWHAPSQTMVLQVSETLTPPPHPRWHTNTQPCPDIMLVQRNYTPHLQKNDTTLTEPNYWIFIGCLRPRRDCSILAWGGHTIKGDESRKCRLLIAPRSHYRPTAAGQPWWRVDTCPNTHTHTHTRRQACIHKCIHTCTAENPHIPILTPSPPLLLKADAIYMSWREVTGSNQPGE